MDKEVLKKIVIIGAGSIGRICHDPFIEHGIEIVTKDTMPESLPDQKFEIREIKFEPELFFEKPKSKFHK